MTVASTVRYLIWDRDQGICGICMLPVPYDRTMHIDHIVPRMAGGTDLLNNLRATHARCNQGRSRECYPQQRVRTAQPTITTSIRLSPALLTQIKRVAKHERRTANEWMRILLEDAIARWFEEHPDLADHPDVAEVDGQQARAR